MKRIPYRPGARRAVGCRVPAAAFLLLALALAGCVRFYGTPSTSTPAPPAVQSSADLSGQAATFWNKGDYPESELLYSRLLKRRDLTGPARAQALDRLAVSAIRSRHPYQAKLALDRRAAEDRSVLTTWPWHERYLETLAALNRRDLLEQHEAWLAAHAELPYSVRSRAVLGLAAIYVRAGARRHAVILLAETHRRAPDRAARAAFAAECATKFHGLSQSELLALLHAGGAADEKRFPQTLIRQELAHRQLAARHAGTQPARAPAAAPAPQMQTGTAASGASTPRNETQRIALILPLSGRSAAMGKKILHGASAAQATLASEGRTVNITAINSEAPGWLQKVAGLPASVTVVGGPLMNPAALRKIATGGELSRRALFAFLPNLEGLREGRQAWRFFPSSRDQMRALVGLTNALGIDSAAVLAPRNAYSQHMAELFRSEAAVRGLRVVASEYYPPKAHAAQWTASVKRLLKVPADFRRRPNRPLPMPKFGAVFIPEDWTPSEMLASDFTFYEAGHLLLLGTNLWSVGMDNAREIDDTSFQRAACPGSWWPESAGARALQQVMDRRALGQADFWAALGYDFVRLAARLDIRPGWTPQDVNAALAASSGLHYSMAPMSWDAGGHARQAMYLFAPHKGGKVLVDPGALHESIARAVRLRERKLPRTHATTRSAGRIAK